MENITYTQEGFFFLQYSRSESVSSVARLFIEVQPTEKSREPATVLQVYAYIACHAHI